MRKMLKLIGWASITGKALLRHACLVQNHLASPTGGVDFDEEFIQHAIIHIWGQVPHKEGVLRAERREQDSETKTKTFVLTNSILVRPFWAFLGNDTLIGPSAGPHLLRLAVLAEEVQQQSSCPTQVLQPLHKACLASRTT